MGNSTVILKECKLLSINDCQPTNSKFSIADILQATRFSSLFIWGCLVSMCELHGGPCLLNLHDTLGVKKSSL